ncbi:uncharacterized protein EDB93DRAFT_1243199 [Suillus bovinus]|uniref:uncharacterized protein n=1 Tax=Suillus bovinus TaxID=48563 RepID=UPI001B86E217|nr:uncharacterized protein EDB93DRAFT_1243199 [Suillus bovinus]KAG2130957.1 hypothetical protein EDB93DRAFT_1243199 [Suillus bovinus]
MTLNCPNCLKDFKSAWAVSRHLSQPLTSYFQMDFELQTDSEETAYVQDMNDSAGYFYGDEGGVVGLESDLLGQALEKPYVERFRNAAKVYRCGQTFQDRFNMDPYTAYRKDNLYYPFASRQDWELSSFLLCSSLSMATIDEFLGLEIVKAISVSFYMAKELRGRAELLPPVPKWQYRIVSTTHPTKQPLHLYWCNPLDCIESLFSHPFFANEMDVTPQCVYDTLERDAAWLMQSQLPDGATLLGVILSSDKTNITNMTGGRVAYLLLISLANIKMATRNKVSSHAFLLTALLPIAEFLHPVKQMQSVLEARLVHQCLDIVLELLKQAARIGWMMSDPLGNLRYSKTTLEQLLSIACDSLDVEGYFDACTPFRLSGIAQPFWCDWSLADPHVFFTPEALHHWHHEFYDHNVKWCLAAVGEQELDFHFSVLQPLTMFRHFKDGISKLKQVTGRAQRDMQHYIVALIADAAPRSVVIAVPTTIDEAHCQKILDALKEFHEHKQGIIACGARRGAKSGQVLNNWHIPKLELMQSVEPSIRQKCQNFHIATSIITRSQSQSQASTPQTTDTVLDDLRGPKRVVTDFFKKAKQVSSYMQVARPLHTFIVSATAIHLNFDPSIRHIPVDVGMAQSFHSLRGQRRALPDTPLPFNDLMVWFKVHVQQASYHSPSIIPPALTVNASSPSATWKYGHYDTAIFTVDDTRREQWPTSGLKGTPFGDILPLDQLCSFAHIIPCFGCAADSCLTAQNSTHFAQTFFLNKYIDKDFYYAISN